MASAEQYRRQVGGLGLDQMKISVSSISEAKTALSTVRSSQKPFGLAPQTVVANIDFTRRITA